MLRFLVTEFFKNFGGTNVGGRLLTTRSEDRDHFPFVRPIAADPTLALPQRPRKLISAKDVEVPRSSNFCCGQLLAKVTEGSQLGSNFGLSDLHLLS